MPKTKANLVKQINACKARIAKERDKLRELIEDVESIMEDCDDAVQDLEHAADSLSELL